jgi:hypothetical protein
MMNARHIALRLATVTVTLAWSCGASAALAPYYERTREMGEILSSPEVMSKLGTQNPIIGIEVVAPAAYRVRSAQCSVEVTLVSQSTSVPIPGPWQFSIQAGEPQCRP